MDETKEQLRLLIDFFTGPFQASHQHDATSSSSSSTQDETQNIGDLIRSAESMATSAVVTATNTSKAPISRQDINLIIRSLELCKKNFTHFSNTEKSYLLPLMTLCSHVLLSETNQIPRSSLATVSDILIYILQFLLNELSAYSDEEANFNEFNAAYYRKLREVHNLSLDSEDYYRYLLKYRITKFLNFMLIGDNDKYEKAFFTGRELYNLCQMLTLKPLPDSLRCHSSNTTTTTTSSSEQESGRSFPVVVTPSTASISSPTFTSSTKRIRLTQPVGSLDRNSKEEFFDQLLTPFIVSSRSNTSPPPPLGHSMGGVSRYQTTTAFTNQPPPLLPPTSSSAQHHSFDSNMDDLTGTKTGVLSSLKSHAAQIKSYLISHNQMYFQYAGGANILLNLVNSYTILRPYILHLGAIEEGANLRFAKLDPAHFELICERIATDLDLVAAIFELNRLLEPLSCDRISKMIVTVQACLYAALTIISHVSTAEVTVISTITTATETAANTSSTETTKPQGGGYEQERSIAEIVAKSLALYSSLFEIFRQSNRVAGQICQNAHMFTAWLLFSGMQLLLNSSRQQQQQQQSTQKLRGTGLANPLAKHALKLMASLLDDLHLEFGDQSTAAILAEESDEASGDSMDELNFLKKFSFTCPASLQPTLKSGGSSATTVTTTNTGTLEQSGSSSSVSSGPTQLSPSASSTGLGSSSQATSKATFKYNKFGHYSAWQRIEMIVSSQLNVIQLLFSYLSTGYRRACLIRTTSLASAASVTASNVATLEEGSAANVEEQSTEAAFMEAAISGGARDLSIEDLYSILLGEAYRNSGQQQETSDDAASQKQQQQQTAASSVLAELRREADSHYGLVIAILDHLNYYYICSKIDALQTFFKQMLTDGQLIALAHIIQDLDAELEGGGSGSSVNSTSTSINSRRLSYPVLSTKTFARFSGALTSLMHNLIAMQILSEEQQNSLLAYLGFKPCPEVEGSSWKLYHGARSLAILAQVILLRQQREKEEIKLDLNSITIQIWRGFINQLKGCSLKWKGDTSAHNEECPVYYEDLNVEHAQLMLFLFHNLKLLQRKHVFYLVGLALHEISVELNSNGFNSSPKVRAVSAAQILFIGRLLHLFEYMCKNLYDTPAYLFEQINHNLLSGNQTPPALAAAAAALGGCDGGVGSGAGDDTDAAAVAKIELEECLRAEKSVDSLRSALFFADKRLECNYFNYILANKDYYMQEGEEGLGSRGGAGGGGGVSSNLGSSNSSFNSSSLTASSTHVNAAASTAASTTGGGGGGNSGGGSGFTAAAAAAAVAAVAANSPNATNTSLSLQEFILHPRFYHLMDVGYLFARNSSSISFVPKLDGMACNFMLAGFPNLSYEAFYNSLLNLFQFLGHQYDVDLRNNGNNGNNLVSPVSGDPPAPPSVTITTNSSGSPNEASGSPVKPPRYPQLGPFGLCCLDYTFQTMWRLVNQLPPTLQSFTDIIEKVESKNYDAADGKFNAAKLINLCLWIPRFENRAVYIWIRELLAKVNNSITAQQQQSESSDQTGKTTVANLEETIAELMTKFNSLQYNYRLFKTVIRTFYHFKVSNSKLSSMISSHSSDHLFSLPHVQFPKFFTLLAVDLFTERVMLLIRAEFTQSLQATGASTEGTGNSSSNRKNDGGKKGSKSSQQQQQPTSGDTILTPANAKALSSDSQELIYEKYLPQMIGLFQKMYSDINTILIYDGPLNSTGHLFKTSTNRSPTTDLKYLFYRSLVNICSTNCFDTSMSDISANIVDFLPHTILLKIDQWNRIHANVERSPGEGQLHELISAGYPMEVPLVEVQSEGGSAAKNNSDNSAYVHHFSAFLNEKYSLSDFPTVNSIETGAGNIAWIKLKQYWFKLFKFAESIYWTKNYYMPSDPFVSQLMSMQLNLVSSSLTHGINETTGTTTVSYKILAKTFDLKADSNEMYCSALYPQFIRNAFFILTILKNRAFTELAEEDQLKFQKVHQDCASEFFMFFSRILKKTSGKVAFEEFLCDTTPTTPTAAAQQATTAASSPSTSTSASAASSATNANTLTNFSFLDLIEVASHPFSTTAYAVNLLKLIKTLLSQADKYPDDISIIRLCSGLSSALAEQPNRVAFLFNWLHMILFHRRADDAGTSSRMDVPMLAGETAAALTTEQSPPTTTTTTTLSPVVYMASDNESSPSSSSSNSDTVYLLYKFVCYVIKDTSRFDETVLAALAEAMLPTARKLLSQSLFDSGNNNFLSFSGLFTCLVLLMSAAGNSDHFIAAYGKPGGHLKLIDEVVSWLTLAKEYLSKKDVIQKIEKNVCYGRHQFILESSYQMLSYLSDIFNALEYKFVYLKSARRPMSTDAEGDDKADKAAHPSGSSSSSVKLFVDDDMDEATAAGFGYADATRPSDDDLDYYDYYGEEEDNEELCEKLCTFTVTQKEFLNQHWYHCHTCKMLDGVGVCNVCAQVCHRGHDVTYSKHGSFFCDCGASEDGTCRALVKRQPQQQASKRIKRSSSSRGGKGKSVAVSFSSSKDRKKLMRISKYWYSSLFVQDFKQWKLSDNYKASRAKFSNQIIAENYERFGLKYEHFENFINLLMTYLTPISDTMLSLVEYFVPTLEDFYCQYSELGFLPRIRKDWAMMHSGNLTSFAGVQSPPLRIEKCEAMLTQVKVSPDSVFENVQQLQAESANHRNLSLLAGAIIRRSSMLVLGASNTYNATSASLNPCLLLVAHDKNRISVVQLNLLLGQVYGSSRRKLSPKKLAAITFPFTVMTMAHNPMNDELIAVCGLKECHVLSLARTGSVTGHYSLMMTLDTNNYIIKALWLPNSQTELAIVTIEFVKIYDLSREDRDSPLYHFVIPSRKIRDMTFYTCEECGSLRRFALVFSSRGQIYAQELTFDAMCDRERERVRGNGTPPTTGGDTSTPFYLTTILNVNFPESWPTSAHQQAVSFSIYYSHLLGMIFVSYFSGESFCAPFSIINIYQQMINNVTSLELGARLPASSSAPVAPSTIRVNFEPLIEGAAAPVRDPNAPDPAASSGNQTYVDQPPLLHWKELTTHPGLIFALTMNTQHPVCFMVKPNTIRVQEVKCKRKVFDYALISCTTNSSNTSTAVTSKDNNGGAVTSIGGPGPEKLTTVITLCEDGSLRFHKVCNEQTNYWLRPNFFNLDDDSYCSQPIAGGGASRAVAKKSKAYAGGKRGEGTSGSSTTGEASTSPSAAQPRFPVDYFEHCTQMNDIEFGGADILEVYNTQQLKNRLSSANMYVACTKPNGFSMTVTQVASTSGGAGSSAASTSSAATASSASSLVMAGIRVNLGVCDPSRAPTAIEIFNRSIPVAINRHRWFDIPFTRAEIAQVAETKTFTIRFAPSGDVNHVTIVDSVRVYGKPRDVLNLMPGEADGLRETSTGADAREDLEQSHEMYADPFARRGIRAVSGGDRSSSGGSPKSSFPKLRLLLYSPTITEDDAMSSNQAVSSSPQYQGIFVLNRLVANCLDVIESSFSFFKSLAEQLPTSAASTSSTSSAETLVMAQAARDLMHSAEYKAKADTSLSIASKLLVISMSDRLDRSVCMLMARLLPSRAAYDEHRDEVIFESSVETMKHLAFDDIIVYYYNLALFREMVTERPRNFVRYVGKYFGSSACADQAGVADMNSLSASDLAGASMQFSAYLSELFWRLYSQRPLSELLAPVTKVSLYENLETMVDSLVYLFYASMLASLTVCPQGQFGGTSNSGFSTTTPAAAFHEPGNALGENQKASIRRTTGLIVQYLCSPDPQVSYSVKKALSRILLPNSNRIYLEKVAKQQPGGGGKHSSKSGSTRERRHSARQPPSKMAPAPPTSAASEGSSAAGAAGGSGFLRGRGALVAGGGGPLRRQGGIRGYRGAGAAAASGAREAPARGGAAADQANRGGTNRDPFGLLVQAAGGRANANQAVVDAAADLLVFADQAAARGGPAAAGANVFERVSAQLMDGDLEAYRNLLLNVPLLGEEFDEDVYLNDLFQLNMVAAAGAGGAAGAGNAGAAAAAQGIDEVDAGGIIDDEDDEDDDDEDDEDDEDDDDEDDDEDDDDLIAIHEGGAGNGAAGGQPPIFPLMDEFANDAVVAAAAAAADDDVVEAEAVEVERADQRNRRNRRRRVLEIVDDDDDGGQNDDDDDEDDEDEDEDDDDEDEDEDEEDYEAMDEAEDAMVELAIALSLQESGQQQAAGEGQPGQLGQDPADQAVGQPAEAGARPRSVAAANALRYFDDLNQEINAVEAAVAELNAATLGRPQQSAPQARIVDGMTPEQRAAERAALEAARVAREAQIRREREELDRFLEQANQLQQQQNQQQQQADYVMLHSESDDEEEDPAEMFDDEMRSLGAGGGDNTTVESIEEDEDDEHLQAMNVSQGTSTTKSRSKSSESVKGSSSKTGAAFSQKASSSGVAGASSISPSAVLSAAALQKASPARHRKRLRKIITSKFCVYLLKQMSNCVDSISLLDGVQAIPFLQVLIMLADFKYQEHDRKDFGQVFSQLMQSLLTMMLNDLGSPIESSVSSPPEPASEASSLTTSFLRGGRRGPAAAVIAAFKHRIPRHPQNEVYIVVMRLFSVFLSRFKHFPTTLFFSGAAASGGAATPPPKDANLSELFICPVGVIPSTQPSTSASTSASASASTSTPTATPSTTSSAAGTSTSTSTSTPATTNTTTSSTSKAVTFDEQSIVKAGSSKSDASSTSTSATVVSEQQQAKEREKLSAASYSLLLTATQLVNSNDQLLTYCLAMLQNLLRSHWRPLHKMESENEEKNKAVVHGETIVYHSKKPIKIRPHLNFIPYDLKPFFMISQPGYLTDAAGGSVSTSTTSTASTSGTPSSAAANTVAANGNANDPSTSLNCSIFSNNVFDKYPELLTEMCLRLPYQLKKLIVTWQAHHATVAQKAAAAASSSGEDPAKQSLPQLQQPITPPMEFDAAWIEVLCEYMMLPSVAAYTRKQVRKLLAYLCGTKERYRQVRDYYSLKTHLRAVRRTIVNHFFDARNSVYALKLADLGLTEEDLEDEEQLDELIDVIITNTFVGGGGDEQSSSSPASINVAMSGEQHRLLNLPYHRLISLVDHLKACLEISTSRLANWQRLCRRELRILPFLFRISLLFGEGVSSIILQLISLAMFTESKATTTAIGGESSNAMNNFILNESKLNADVTAATTSKGTTPSAAELNMSALCRYVFSILDRALLGQFIRYFLLESNSTQHRWAAHSLLYHFYQCLQPRQQEQLLALFWKLWPSLACYGKRGSQFVDLLGYFTLNTNRSTAVAANTSDPGTSTATATTAVLSSPVRVAEMERQYAEAAIGLLKHQNQVLAKHPNANIYNSLQSLLEFNGFYLETEPCLVCNNPEVNFVPVKLSAIKLDSRYTTYTHIVKMIGSHTISKIALKISELKKSKMVKTLTIYYNNRYVASVVELKNKSTVWQRAKRVNLALNQTEVKIDFALPIVACNLMIEYSAFYETAHSNTETLQCPRCSSIVPANPGVCTNCGENVFQCHKCRAINYDEKDPFLCNSCGFCKYAKFDYVLTARYTATAVETIENEEDRAKAVTTINSLLDKADKLYKTILAVRPSLEQLLLYSQDYNSTVYCLTDGGTSVVDSLVAASGGTAGGGPSTAGMASAASVVNGVPAAASTAAGGSSSSNFHVNRYIQQLAHRYCNDCRLHFDELSKIVQKVLYTRKELVDYDNRQAAGSRSNYEELKRLMAERRATAARLHQQQQQARGIPLSASNCSLNQCPSIASSASSSSDSSSASTLVENVGSGSGLTKSGLPRLRSNEDVVEKGSRKRICSPETAVGTGAAGGGGDATPAEPSAASTTSTTAVPASIVVENYKSGRCFGCSSATIEHCITLLKALAYTPRYKAILSSSSLFRELIDYNLRLGTGSFRAEIRSLLCLLTRDNAQATEEFNNLLLEKIKAAFQSHYMTSFDFGSIRHEMALLAASFDNEDSCWEQRLRCVMKLFLLSLQNKSPAVLEAITLPCLRILYGLIIKPKSGESESAAEADQAASVLAAPGLSSSLPPSITFDSLMVNVTVDLGQWLSGDPKASFAAWKRRNQRRCFGSPAIPDGSVDDQTATTSKPANYDDYLADKYFARWQYLYESGRLRSIKSESFAVRIASSNWIREVLFNPTSKALRVACRQLLMALFERLTNQQRVLIDLLTTFLDDLCAVGGETGLEYYDLYRSIIFSEFSPATAAKSSVIKEKGSEQKSRHWRYYLALTGLLQHLGKLITEEITRLKALEEATLSSDFGQGFALRQLVELLQIFIVDDRIRRAHKSSMVGFVLDGYLSLRMLIVQRTKMIDETQTALLELLELLTTGTRVETINFMKVCIESVKKCSILDQRTPVFIFERLCSIIYPEEKDADEFFISLEKDPQQEDFLQGRMLGNPYSSKDPGMGPLMRDIKNKICQECELVSLLEDDSGLELLVNNKIISLDLSVKEVYKRIVQADSSASVAASSSGGSVGSGVSTASWSSLASAAHLNLQSADIALIDSLAAGGGGFSLASLMGGGAGAGGGARNAAASGAGPTMKITYRIRGLMGDATEEFIESFANKESVVEDDEKRYELAAIMAEGVGGDGSSGTSSTTFCGLQVMLERFEAVEEITNRSRQLLFVLLKLFGYCVKVVANRRALISPQLNTIGAMLGIARLFVRSQAADLLTTPSAPGQPSYFEQLLTLMETLMAEASRQEATDYDLFNATTCGTAEDVRMLMDAVTRFDSVLYSATVNSLTAKILRIVTFLALGNAEKAATLLGFFKPYFDFDAYDRKQMHLENPEHRFELLCSLLNGIERNKTGNRMKDLLIEEGFVPTTIEYLVRNAPPMKNCLLINNEEWKDFTSRPALKYVLRMLTGLSHGHENTQLLITRDAIPIIHGLEQVLTDSHMATLAENLMDAIKENPSVEAKIEEVRLKTREEKKRIAMAVREKQLGELGMRANDKGQVMADSQLLKAMEEQTALFGAAGSGDEKGLVCSICREGYQYQAQKVLAVYTFTKRCNVDEHEDRRPRKTVGYTTVTHFNIIHVECHMSAVRHARTRDEWQSAALHNANTRCNGLLPLWGPQVYESLFAHALARHNSYLHDAVGQRDFTGSNSFLGTVHDLKLLLVRFATESTFMSEETGGGGAQSNLYLTPYLAHTALYVMNTTKVAERERANLETNFFAQPADKWIESAFAADSAYFWAVMTLLLQSKTVWAERRLYVLKRLILCEHLRKLPADQRTAAALAEKVAQADGEPVAYATIKPALMFFAMINLFYTVMFKSVETTDQDTDWSSALATYIRHNDQLMLESADKMLELFENDLLLSTSFGEFADAADLMRGQAAIADPDAFLKDALKLPD